VADQKSLLSLDRRTRIRDDIIVTSDAREVHIETTQDCEPILEAVKGARDLPVGKHMRFVGSIPLTLYYKWMREAGISPSHADTTRKMTEVVKRKLQSNEYQHLLVRRF
jgi:hypothetical protein